ncbi:hypothetical protein E5S69_31435 [Cupriavidus necator]|uniref:3TM-type holin n=1 Tax=Cupriavidus necator TaxID=106590 RepID=UPI00148F5327|nr:3TM-type holin [Cupriavidus necator]NOV28000.1 hypothetical protein [Cupriavidus necator]
MALDPITAGIDLAKTVVQTIWPDKSDEEKQKLAAALAIVQGQIQTNQAEAASPNVFTSGWRPAVGWVCAAALAYQFILRPLVAWGFVLAGHQLPTMPGLDDTLWELLFGMLGLGGLRSLEKVKGVAR